MQLKRLLYKKKNKKKKLVSSPFSLRLLRRCDELVFITEYVLYH